MNIKPDKQKAKALLKMADITYIRLNESNILKYPTNTLTDYYDIIHKIFEAITLSDGIKFHGEGAHKKLIDYICDEYNLGKGTKIFLQNLRDYRNKISYEGFTVKKEYIERNVERINEIIHKAVNIESIVEFKNMLKFIK